MATIARILGLPDGDIERFTPLVYAMSPGRMPRHTLQLLLG